MTKNGIILSVIAVLLGAVYVYYFSGWLTKPTMHIIPSVRLGIVSNIRREPGSPPVHRVTFGLNREYEFTSVKVVHADEYATNKHAAPIWHLVSDSNSVPTKAILYGAKIRGMKPAIPQAQPEPLEVGADYLLLLEAGNIKAQTNFHTTAAISLRK